MKIGVLGTGFGAYHAKLLKQMDGVDGVTVFGRNNEKLKKMEAELEVDVTTDLDRVLRDPSIDIIDICLPTALHSEIAVRAMSHGKQVFCETPVSLTPEEAEQMLEAEVKYGRKVLVNRFILFDPAYAYLRECALRSTYGRLLSLSLYRETAPLWGDLSLSRLPLQLMIHELDLAASLASEPALEYAWGTEYPNPGESLVNAVIGFGSASPRITVMASSGMPSHYPFTVGFEAYFESAKLVYRENCDNGESSLLAFKPEGEQKIELRAVDPYAESLKHAIQVLGEVSGAASTISDSPLSLRGAAESLRLAHGITGQINR
ncbi:Gfo/Idh/MocA family oxidoreductase [Paenibacillus sp. HN-1]|uniref:Gfo/Idh/MocA family protein n=1 Tax=Paenibacillus TaxID=44249 RepID=UPI001CA8011A|nr:MULTISPECIES: Gfo/Idh/MocA family oxidoreductase [Paenibacillus]MBY9079224.1 Gfo/Idh/MocA family oxidoreductase [Paenibacillus sp. CGMCC 1.18879]MBY9086947.1 Gfo/Idh/MocA family oxidoreductase [Paenibacillus sinensis]